MSVDRALTATAVDAASSDAPAHRPARRRAVAAACTVSVLGLGLFAAASPASADTTSTSALSSTVGTVNGTLSAATAPVGTLWGDASASPATGGYDPAQDPGSLYTIENAIGARSVWLQQDAAHRQITGQGVGVAVLDTGSAQVPGLDGQGQLSYGPDLSIESNSAELTDHDTNGHGTHITGIIAAHDPAVLSRQNIRKLSPSVQLGVAPDASIESLKLATTDGSTDVSQVIAALDWITQHPTMSDGVTPIRVVNLAYGTDSVQPYQVDPLAAAAENAWKHGIVVVVSGGNGGPSAGHVSDPAMDPYVLAVGASDGVDSPAGWTMPSVASFSSSGNASRHVDLVAPGRSIVSLRAPGSYVDRTYPEGLVTGDTSGRLFRGSGTSQASAVTTGAVALLLQAYPNLTPDQVKYVLTHSASPVWGGTPTTSGAGEIDVDSALHLAQLMSLPAGRVLFPASTWRQTWPSANGSGSIEAARAGSNLVDPQGNVLAGEIDVQGMPWDPAAWWAATSSLTAWDGGRWNGATWTGSGWASYGSWDGSRWDGSRWDGSRWDGSRWDGSRWDGSRWDGSRWDGSRWSASRWDGSRWSADNWN